MVTLNQIISDNTTLYYTEMNKIVERLRELGKMNYPHCRSHYAPNGSLVTEDVPEYLEEKALSIRFYELLAYDRALAGIIDRNDLSVSHKLDMLTRRLSNDRYDPTIAGRIAVSVYNNRPAPHPATHQ